MPKNEEMEIAVIRTDISYIKKSLDALNNKMDNFTSQYVTQTEFKPIKGLVYGFVGLTLISVMGAILAIVIQK